MKSIFKTIMENLFRKQQFERSRLRIEDYNYNALATISLIGTLIGVVLLILSTPVVSVLKLTFSYFVLTMLFAICFILTKTVLKNKKKASLKVYYILMISIMLFSIYMGTVVGTDTNATTFFIFLLLLPNFIIDYPWRLILTDFFIVVIFCVVVVQYKTGVILSLDISNTVAVFTLSAIAIVFNSKKNLSIFDMLSDKSNELLQQKKLINSIPVGVAKFEVKAQKTKQVFTNDEFYRLFEDTPKEREKRCGGNFLNSIHPDDREYLQKVMKSVFDGEDYIVAVCRSQKGDGSYLWVRFASAVAKRDGDYLEIYSTYTSMEDEIKNKQASEAKTLFLSRMSHDIRTPMNAIIGMTNLAKNENNPEKLKEYLDNIDHSSEFLLGLINDILDLSKIESGEFQLNNTIYDIDEFRADVKSIILPLMKKKNIELTYDIESDIKKIITDKQRFNQIFFNLLSNAAKFTNNGGKVEFVAKKISTDNEFQKIRFIVKDNGIGMSEEFQKEIFTPFIQDSYHQSEGHIGTGLGLPIVKSIVDAMDGKIEVNSKINCGTKIIIDLSFKMSDDKKVSSPSKANISALNNTNILIAEDNDMNILVLTKLLESKNCNVFISKNGKECLEIFKKSDIGFFDIILMDIRMPMMNGIEATKCIRLLDREDAKTVPIVALTADAFTEEKKKTIDAGMNVHLTKPIAPNLLFNTIVEYLGKKSK